MKNNCEIVRRELDELMLNERSSAVALTHLRECADCREFQEKQTKLREMVGSLGTVAAPADFDFRLRARLADESHGAAFHLNSLSSLFARRGLAVAAALLLFLALGVIVVRNLANRQERVEVAESNQQAPTPARQANPAPATQPREIVSPAPAIASAGQNDSPGVRPGRVAQRVVRPRRNMTSQDFSSRRPESFDVTQAIGSSAFAIDASPESFKVSFDDGRGNARTISLPTIRFGSQRILPGANQYAATKGVW